MVDFKMQPMDTILECLKDINGLINQIKNKPCLQGQRSSMDLILTNRNYSFTNSSLYDIRLSDHHHLIYAILKSTLSKSQKQNPS